jgi:hypothetical protein
VVQMHSLALLQHMDDMNNYNTRSYTQHISFRVQGNPHVRSLWGAEDFNNNLRKISNGGLLTDSMELSP